MLAKVIIAVVAFPLFAHILFTFARWVLRLVEPTLPVTESGADVVRQVSVWVAVLLHRAKQNLRRCMVSAGYRLEAAV